MYERNYQAMFEQFVSALENNPGNLNTITSKLSFARTYDINNNVDTIIKKTIATPAQESGLCAGV